MNVVSFLRIMNFILLMIQRSVTCCETPRSNIQKEMKTESHELRRHCHAHTVRHMLHQIISIVSSDGSALYSLFAYISIQDVQSREED